MHLSSVNMYSFMSLFVLMSLSSLIIFLLKPRLSTANWVELDKRMQSWWVMILLLILALAINTTLMLCFFGFVSYLALKEYMTIIPTRRVDRRIIFIAYISIPLQYYWIGIHWYGMFIIFIPIFMFLLLPMRMVTLKQTKGFLKASGTMQWGVMMTVFCLSHIAYLGVLPNDEDWQNKGISLILYLIVLTQLNDISQYVWGKCLGKRKIIPEISPNKTVAGFLGGVFTTCILAVVLGNYLTPFNWYMALGAGLIISVSGFIGDLTMSAVKRDLGIKDTGQLLPGHGGILDRMDSVIYTAPLFFHYMRYFYY
ncbi:phosphatidate cytidylyltransferase [Legionella quateirensis]|uniref:Phosphatidate cytidylyltransferase n=1 Tax=Legionella quateirensis TaxID=45072 RepID=A0A378KTU7_9GAMM|nr:phosphatidate cytidylyltransferase [Legionella quateirensis]KTD54727.1 phosphatidate cytidylyltransferase [Legionella quateirensis]STY16907.1 phosphatidate cytidylyltransferase [Legionella quateirensis]